MAKTNLSAPDRKIVDPELIASALAKATDDGDIVNFRTLFESFSPARETSVERFEDEKYASYLLPDDTQRQSDSYRQCLALVQTPAVWAHIEGELREKRPAQLPAELVLHLADRAVALGKFSSAAQAYELLRIREKMLDQFLVEADAALDADNMNRAVTGYRIARGLAYDYAAFPEPLPSVLNYQTRALMLHGDYPETPEDAIGMADPQIHVQQALTYLLLDPGLASRLETRPLDTKVAFVKEWVYQMDPGWSDFASRFRDASQMTERLLGRMQEIAQEKGDLADEIESQTGDSPAIIMEILLGRSIDPGEWWQYLKELAYQHPASVLFLARQIIRDGEYVIPRFRAQTPLAVSLGLE